MVCDNQVRSSKCPSSSENGKPESAWNAQYLRDVIAFLKHLDSLYLELVWLVWEECNTRDLQVMKLKCGQKLYFVKEKENQTQNPKSNTHTWKEIGISSVSQILQFEFQ